VKWKQLGPVLTFAILAASSLAQGRVTRRQREYPSALPSRVPGFPRLTQSLGASRRKAGALPALDPDIVAAEIVEDLQAALAQFAEIAADLRK
jgi:hypothetical protein